MTEETLRNTPTAWSIRADTAETPWEAAGWTEDGQRDRMVKIMEALAPEPGEILFDYGCGTGALVDHLPKDVGYIGFDWAPGMITRARREHPHHLFLDRIHKPVADLVAVIGTFNLPGNKAETWQMLRWLWFEVEPRAMAVSLYAGDDERCLKYGMGEVWHQMGGLSHRVIVKDWRHNDILAVVRR